jgi:2-haloalkanoic acid dehalogenase type II
MQPPSGRSRVVVAKANLRGYRGITFDAFGPLLDGGPGHLPTSFVRIIERSGKVPERQVLANLWEKAFRKQVRSEPFVTFREVHRRSFADVLKELGIANDVEGLIDATFDEYRTAKAFPEVSSVLHDLERDVPLAVVSNMDTRILLEALQANGLAFTFVITSEEEQRYKPDASLFRRAVRYLGLPPEHVLHVGSSYAEDVLGASSIGMASVLIGRTGGIDTTPKGEAKAKVRDLGEVRDFVRNSWQES